MKRRNSMNIRSSVRRVICGLAAILAATALMAPHTAWSAQHNAKKRLLVVTVTKGFRHGSIAMAERTIEELGKKTGEWDTDFVRTDDDMKTKMTGEALKQYDAVVFANPTGDLPLPEPLESLQLKGLPPEPMRASAPPPSSRSVSAANSGTL